MTFGETSRRRGAVRSESGDSEFEAIESGSLDGGKRLRRRAWLARFCSFKLRVFVIVLFFFGVFGSVVHYVGLDTDTAEQVLAGSVKSSRSPLGSLALVFIAHDRPEYFRESLASVLAARDVDKVDIYVSMDAPAHYAALESVIGEFPSASISVWHNVMPFGNLFFQTSDDRITYHHKTIFRRVFEIARYDYAIMMESDLTVSTDFFEYMFAAGRLLVPTDISLFCISGWNDNGMLHFVQDESRLFRTDYFPGLGWMMHRSSWTDILVYEWPGRLGNYAYDIWLREHASTRFRDCIVPEVSRTHHIAKYGSHVNGLGHTWYDRMVLASGNVTIAPAEIELVGSMDAFEKRIIKERINPAKIVEFRDPFPIPYKKSIIVFMKDDASFLRRLVFGTPSNYYKTVQEAFGLFNANTRSSHKGLVSKTLEDKRYGGTNVTLVSERMRTYWGL